MALLMYHNNSVYVTMTAVEAISPRYYAKLLDATMTDQELRDLVAENTKNIANLSKVTNQLVKQMQASDKKWTDAINIMIQLGYRVDNIESTQNARRSDNKGERSTESEVLPQAAKSRS